MVILDADVEPSISSSNVKAVRDLVQFVPYNKFANNPDKLSQNVLEEIPRQVVDYYKLINKPPGRTLQ